MEPVTVPCAGSLGYQAKKPNPSSWDGPSLSHLDWSLWLLVPLQLATLSDGEREREQNQRRGVEPSCQPALATCFI